MDTYEQRLAAWETELRAKYTDADRKKMAGKEAMPDGSYPIKDEEDLSNAIHAVGRGTQNSHNAIRKHIMARANALGMSKEIPDNWNADGSLKQQNAASTDVVLRDEGESTATTLTHTAAGDTLTPISVTRRRKQRRRAVPLVPEVRRWAASGLEVRSAKDTDEIIITGQPIVYDVPYMVADKYGEFEERMLPGVAAGVLPRADVRLLFNHEGMPLARSTSGTMTLTDGPKSLSFEARLDARQQLANDLAVAIERGDVSQMSCGFIVARDEWDDEYEHRAVQELADLLDVSPVTFPASPTTSIAIARRMAADLRAGKILSQANQAKLVEATKSLHHVLSASGFDPNSLLDNESPAPDDDMADEGSSEPMRMDDGSVSADTTAVSGSAAVQDGTGTRSLSNLRLQAETRRRRRSAA